MTIYSINYLFCRLYSIVLNNQSIIKKMDIVIYFFLLKKIFIVIYFAGY